MNFEDKVIEYIKTTYAYDDKIIVFNSGNIQLWNPTYKEGLWVGYVQDIDEFKTILREKVIQITVDTADDVSDIITLYAGRHNQVVWVGLDGQVNISKTSIFWDVVERLPAGVINYFLL